MNNENEPKKNPTNDLEEEIKSFNHQKILDLIPQYSNIKLADIVISYRYLDLYEELSIAAMEELVKRRINGDSFDYEQYIENNLNTLPKLEFKVGDITSLMNAFKSLKRK